jgi:hypothetical protein
MRPPEPTEEDVAWTEERTIALMHLGLAFTDACELATRECTERVLRRHERAVPVDRALLAECERREANAEAAERARYRAELEAKAAPGQRPTLQVSLGDLLRKRRTATR